MFYEAYGYKCISLFLHIGLSVDLLNAILNNGVFYIFHKYFMLCLLWCYHITLQLVTNKSLFPWSTMVTVNYCCGDCIQIILSQMTSCLAIKARLNWAAKSKGKYATPPSIDKFYEMRLWVEYLRGTPLASSITTHSILFLIETSNHSVYNPSSSKPFISLVFLTLLCIFLEVIWGFH